MNNVVFIGDELSATGFRLAGLEVSSPPLGKVSLALAEARSSARAILITAAAASHMDKQELHKALIGVPPVAIVPDICGAVRPPDLAQRLRTILGIEA